MNPVLRLIEAKKSGKPMTDQVKRPAEFCRTRIINWQSVVGMIFATSIAYTVAKLSIRTVPRTMSGDWQKESEKIRRQGDFSHHVDPDEI